MKKFLLLLSSTLLLTGCFNNSNEDLYKDIPVKNDINGVTIEASSVNTQNIDNYLFRDDTVYVDLRPYNEIAKEVQQLFSNEFFRVYTNNDVAGAETCSAMKNSIAIATKTPSSNKG